MSPIYSGGSGSGGSSSSPWVGPYAFSFADYNPALGSGWDGILIEDALPAGRLLLRVAFIIDVDFDNAAGLSFYAGTLAGDDYGGPALAPNASSYGGEFVVTGLSSGALPPERGGLVTGEDVSQVWLDSFDGPLSPPSAGSGRLWLELATPVAP